MRLWVGGVFIDVVLFLSCVSLLLL